MTSRVFAGEYIHKHSNTVLQYVCRYHFSAVGVVYEADAGIGSGRTATLVSGVITWGLRAIPPKGNVERAVHEAIDIVDIEKFRALLEDAAI